MSLLIRPIPVEIEYPFPCHIDPQTHATFVRETEALLQKYVPSSFWELSPEKRKEEVPFVTMGEAFQAPASLSFCVLSLLRERSFPFFYEMITRWVVPGERIPAIHAYATDLRFSDCPDTLFTLSEVILYVEKQETLELIKHNFPLIQQQIVLGTPSAYYARRILDMQGMPAEEKVVHIHEHIAHLAKRLPTYFGQDVFPEMQHFLVLCADAFIEGRTFHHLSRLVSLHYLFRSRMRQGKGIRGFQRRFHRKVFRAHLVDEGKERPVVGVFLGMHFLREKEVFEERGFLHAIRAILPDVESVPGSYFLHRKEEAFATSYIEIEKKEGIRWDEIRRLWRELPGEVEKRIEQLVHPVFMPRNEEEIMRNMLVLSQQLRYVRDIPQVFISFDEQTDRSLFYTVILARVLRDEKLSLQEQFTMRRSPLQYIHDRTRRMGYIRKRYPKEATVFRVGLNKEPFLRQDLSIDLYRARRFILEEITHIVGPVRDYNGGMISKERETFSHVEDLLSTEGKGDRILMEKFFFSITPIIMRTMVDPKWFLTLFQLLKKTLEEGTSSKEQYTMTTTEQNEKLFLLVQGESFEIKDALQIIAQEISLPSTDYLIGHLWMHDIANVGFICRISDPEKKVFLLRRAQEEIDKANSRLKSNYREQVTDRFRRKILFKNHYFQN